MGLQSCGVREVHSQMKGSAFPFAMGIPAGPGHRSSSRAEMKTWIPVPYPTRRAQSKLLRLPLEIQSH